MTSRKTYKFWVPPHTANCVVEQGGQLKSLKATVAPKIEFKNGQAEKIWINLTPHRRRRQHQRLAVGRRRPHRQASASSIGAMIKSVNGYIYKHCPKKYPQAQAAKPAPKAK